MLILSKLFFCKTQYDEYQAVDLLRSQPQGSEKESRPPSLPSASSHKPSSMSAPAAVPVSAELLNRRERRKGKATAVASGLPVPPVAAVSLRAASQQMSTAKVHQQMAEMKRYTFPLNECFSCPFRINNSHDLFSMLSFSTDSIPLREMQKWRMLSGKACATPTDTVR